jgi:hypothetical protein
MQFHSYNLMPKIIQLKKDKKNFVLKTTNSSIILKYNNNTFVQTFPFFKNKHLYLFAAIKKEIMQNIKDKNIHIEKIQYRDILYFLFSPALLRSNYIYDNVAEFDISKAYITTAHNLGLLSDSFFNKMCELPKRIRLVILGSIATVLVVQEFKEGKVLTTEIKNNELLSNVWRLICKTTGEAMQQLINLSGFLFFWVDGVYFNLNVTPLLQILELIENIKGYEFKQIPLESIEKINNFCIVKKVDGISKHFFILR